MNYFLTEEQQMIKDLAAKIAVEKAAPHVAELDEKEEFPWEVMNTLASSDLFGVYLPEEYGGFGGGVFELCLVTEELSKVCCGMGVCYAASALGTLPILLFGS
ncbi:MAG: acyl-CoA dehydrogenase family protein, partial [bacterium]